MSGRLIAQVIVSLGTVVGRAFVAAYKQAAANAAQGGGAAAGGARSGTKEGVLDALTRKTNMSFEEACQILNVTKDADTAQLTKNYDHLFKVNEASQGGSFYLQSKVVRAKERFEMEKAEANKNETQNTQDSTSQSQSPPPS